MLAPAPAAPEEGAPPPQRADREYQALLSKADEFTHAYRMRQELFKLLECALLVGGALVAQVIVLRCLKGRPDCGAAAVVNATGLVYIVFGTIVLVILTDTEAQLTAPMGILGAVAGYLFGTMRRGGAGEGAQGGEGES
ncbi:MAG: hypothetical protein Kow0092_14010 [Deferrisomatales bacterium]